MRIYRPWQKGVQVLNLPIENCRRSCAHKVPTVFHYENTPINIYRKFYLQKMEIFR